VAVKIAGIQRDVAVERDRPRQLDPAGSRQHRRRGAVDGASGLGTSIAQAQWESETYCQNCAGYAQLGQWCWNDTECCSGYCETPARRDQGRSGPGERTVVGARTG
jgi:hypothetical protein